MKPAWRYLAAGAAAYLSILVITFPATHVRGPLQDSLPGLDPGVMHGSVFAGHSARVSYRGQELGPVDWHFRPLSLLLLRIEYRLALSHPDNSGRVIVGIRPGGEVYGHDLELQLAPQRLLERFSPVALDARGTLALALEHFEVTGEGVRGVTGTLSWRDAAIESPLALPLGDVELALESRDDTLAATVTRGGELGISGEILLLPGNRYAVDLQLRPGDKTAAETRALIESVMDPHPAGGFRLQTTGNFQAS